LLEFLELRTVCIHTITWHNNALEYPTEWYLTEDSTHISMPGILQCIKYKLDVVDIRWQS